MQDEDYNDEIDTTAEDFDALWAEAEPVDTQTLVPFVSHSYTSTVSSDVKVAIDVSWSGHSVVVESESAYARLVAG